MRRRQILVAAGCTLGLLGAGTVWGFAQTTAEQDVTCHIDAANVLSCPLPAASTETVTETATTTETQTATVTATETAPGPTTTVTEPGPTTTVPGPTTTVPGPTTTVPGPTTTVTTTVTATPTTTSPPPPGCALPNYPDASCTGVPVGTVLTAYTGPTSITTANTVIDSKTVTSCLTVRAPGVIIRKSNLHCSGTPIDLVTGGSLTVNDSTVTCNGTNGTGIETDLPSGTAFTLTVTRANISGCENGFDADANTLVQDSYIHDLFQGAQAHTDGLQTAQGKNLSIIHNRIYANNGTSAIITAKTATAPVNVLYQNNLMAGGAFTLYCDQNGAGTNFRVIGNAFSTVFYPTVGAFGPATDCADETQSGNFLYETGAPLTLQ